MAELADASDSKSDGSDIVWVQVPFPPSTISAFVKIRKSGLKIEVIDYSEKIIIHFS